MTVEDAHIIAAAISELAAAQRATALMLEATRLEQRAGDDRTKNTGHCAATRAAADNMAARALALIGQ